MICSADGLDSAGLGTKTKEHIAMRDSLFFFLHMALFRKPFVYCCVYIHPQAFYKNLVYCILLSYICYLLRAFFHNDHSLCFYMCVFEHFLVLKQITRTHNLPDYVNKIISAGYYECITEN